MFIYLLYSLCVYWCNIFVQILVSKNNILLIPAQAGLLNKMDSHKRLRADGMFNVSNEL